MIRAGANCCGLARFSDFAQTNPESKAYAVPDPQSEDGELITLGDFGCNQHQEK